MTEGISFDNYENRGATSMSSARMPSYDRFADAQKMPYMYKLAIRIGLAKSEEQAKKMLVIIAISLVILSLIVMFASLRPPKIKSVHVQARPKAVQETGTVPAEASKK